MYISNTLRKYLAPSLLEAYGAWFGLRVLTSRPLPNDEVGFVIESANVRLEVPGRKAQPWHPGMAYRRIRHDNDALRHAIALEPGATVLDCTLGMGHDALALAHAGATVYALEIQAPMILYTLTGMWGFDSHLARRIHARRGDYQVLIQSYPDNAMDHVYLDPMFPKSDIDRAGQTWSMLRSFTPADQRMTRPVLEHALRVARRNVVLKLAPGEECPLFDGILPPEIVGSKRQRYARWQSPLIKVESLQT